MKNKVIMLCAAAAVLAACAKTEVTPPAPASEQEITFLTAPVTKAHSDFATTNVFQSAAFYDVKAFVYGSSSAEEYIPASKVKYFTDAWRVASAANEDNPFKYYWPKDGGKLTFFSWSLGTNSLKFSYTPAPAVTITKDNGVKVTGYSSQNNDDFMVADIQKDQTANTTPGTYKTPGVPTLFRHKTALVAFKAVTADDYSVAPYLQTFTIKEISFQNVATAGTYTQYDATDPAGEKWSKTATGNLTYFSGSQGVSYNSGTAQDVTKTATELYIPETYLSNIETNYQKLQVKYTVSRANGISTSSKDYVAEIPLLTLLTNSIEAGKKYIITLTFTLDEILWDPAIEDWTDGTSGSGTIDSTNSTAS